MASNQTSVISRPTITSSGTPVSTVYGAAVNNAILDPLQGFDADVYVVDQATGAYMLVGRFVSIQVTIRNATEPYMEFNQRVPRFLDGEFQIGWVLERGHLEHRVLEYTFGLNTISRELRLNRSPRFQITFQLLAPELDEDPQGYSGILNSGDPLGERDTVIGNGEIYFARRGAAVYQRRRASGQYVLTFCKVDSFSMGAMAGRSVIANRWEGLAEGIQQVNRVNIWGGTSLDSAVAASKALATASPANDPALIGFPKGLDGLVNRNPTQDGGNTPRDVPFSDWSNPRVA
jgi:hypothetical protein